MDFIRKLVVFAWIAVPACAFGVGATHIPSHYTGTGIAVPGATQGYVVRRGDTLWALAKKFGATDSHKFINGVLDKVATKLREVEVLATKKS